MSFDFSTLVTNRSSSDVAYVRQLVERFVAGTATNADREAWNSIALKGAYNHTDLNRVNSAMSAINELLQAAGYATTYKPFEIARPDVTVRVPIDYGLPIGYVALDYIQSTGTQYINTLFNPNQDTRIIMDIEYTKAVSMEQGAFGSRIAYGNSMFLLWTNTNNEGWQDGFNKTLNYPVGSTITGRVVIDKNKNTLSVNDAVISTATYSAFSPDYPLFLLTVDNGGSPMISDYPTYAKVYSCQIYDNGTLVREYVPCKNTQGTVGLYDFVNGVFYTNSGTGEFIAGTEKPQYEVVTIPDSSPTNAWVESDMPTIAQMHDYLTNIQGLRNILSVYDTTPTVPTDMNELTIVKANNIEQILVDIEQLIRWMVAGYVRSSAPSFYSGGFPLPTENTYKGHTWATLDTLGLTWEQVDSMTWFQLLYV